MSTQEFTGHVSAMRADAEFFGAEDFMGRGDVPVQIIKCVRSVDRQACGKKQKEMFSLFLKVDGKPATKELWIKPTNRKQVTRLYGPNVADWKGNWLWLYVDEVRSPQGGMTLGIRIRDKKDAPQTQQRQTNTAEGELSLVGKYAKRLGELKTREEIEAAYRKFDQVAPTMDDATAQEIYKLFAQYTNQEGG